MVYTRLFRTFNGYKQLSHLKFFHGEATNHELVQKAEAVVKRFGQPTPATHPHLLKPGEVTPGIAVDEYRSRRHNLIDAIKKYSTKLGRGRGKGIQHHVVVIPSAVNSWMSLDVPYVFHQNADFLYTCGFQEPNSVLVLVSTTRKTCPADRSVMFVEERSFDSELRDGPVTGPDGAVELLGVDEAFRSDHLQEFLMKFMKGKNNIALWYDFNRIVNPKVDKVMKDISNEFDSSAQSIEAPQLLIQHLKLRKSPAEISLLQRSNVITSEAFIQTIKSTLPGSTEHDLSAKMEYECKVRGAKYLGYPPAVAGGTRATIINYIENNQRLSKGELIVMEAGCYHHGYASDINRTWPVDGKFTIHQKILYEAVLEVQLLLLAELDNSRCSLEQFDTLYYQLLGRNLQQIGIIPKSVPRTSLESIAEEFCPHVVGHYLGMDSHDCELLPWDVELEPGMAIAIETAVYIDENNEKVPAEFRGMGIRIGDNVVITDSGYLNLTQSCPKETRQLESLMSEIEG